MLIHKIVYSRLKSYCLVSLFMGITMSIGNFNKSATDARSFGLCFKDSCTIWEKKQNTHSKNAIEINMTHIQLTEFVILTSSSIDG